jgi:hypothetical protein
MEENLLRSLTSPGGGLGFDLKNLDSDLQGTVDPQAHTDTNWN